MDKRGEAEALICGTVGRFHRHLEHVNDIIGRASGVGNYATMTGLIVQSGMFFIADTQVTPEPTSENIAETTLLSSEMIRRFGIPPTAALLSHSNFGASASDTGPTIARPL